MENPGTLDDDGDWKSRGRPARMREANRAGKPGLKSHMGAGGAKKSLYSARGKNDHPPSKNRKARQQAIQPFTDQFVLLFPSVTPS